MSLRLRVDGTGEPREFSFDRDTVSIGRGPLNDICVPHEALAKRVGLFETHDTGTRFVYLGCDGFLAAHLRETQRTRAPESGRAEWTLKQGDQLVFGPDKAELVVTVLEVGASGPCSSIDVLELATPDSERIPVRLARFVSQDPTPASLLRALASRLFEIQKDHDFEATITDVCITTAPCQSTYFDETFVLENPRFEDGIGVGEVKPGANAIGRLGATRVVFEAMKKPGQAIIDTDDDAVVLGVAVHTRQRIAAIITTRIEGLGARQAHLFANAMHQLDGLNRVVLELHETRKEVQDLVEENRYFRERERRHYLFKELIVESQSMRQTYDALHELVDTRDPILIHGEAGTGKELLARALHHLGQQKKGMLISLNCAQLEDTNADVELFGSVQNRLSGAVAARKGVFELASKGTVYLAEVDNLSPLLQGKLVRMINEGEVRRAGDSESRDIDARLIVSVHRDLNELVREGAIRRDLYIALRENVLHVPALRERREDTMPLARVFLRTFAARYKKNVTRFSEQVEAAFLDYHWPGNARELQTRVESATLTTTTDTIELEDLDITSPQ